MSYTKVSDGSGQCLILPGSNSLGVEQSIQGNQSGIVAQRTSCNTHEIRQKRAGRNWGRLVIHFGALAQLPLPAESTSLIHNAKLEGQRDRCGVIGRGVGSRGRRADELAEGRDGGEGVQILCENGEGNLFHLCCGGERVPVLRGKGEDARSGEKWG